MKSNLPFWLLALLGLAGCAGYHLGRVENFGVNKVFIPVFKNKTMVPHIEEKISNTVIHRFQYDGTIRITPPDDAEAILEGEILKWERKPLRTQSRQLLVTKEYRLVLTAHVVLRRRDGSVILNRKKIEGETTYLVGDDAVASERQAFPLAAEDLSKNIVTQVTEGWALQNSLP